jgi:hypothetical protein
VGNASLKRKENITLVGGIAAAMKDTVVFA